MSSANTIEALNHLLVLHHRSFPQYLTYAKPWVSPEGAEAWQVVEQIAKDHAEIEQRITEMLDEEGQSPELGNFPLLFADLHDLSVDFLLNYLIAFQRQLIGEVEPIVDQLALAPFSRALAAESLGMAKGHLELLEEQRQLA